MIIIMFILVTGIPFIVVPVVAIVAYLIRNRHNKNLFKELKEVLFDRMFLF